MSTSEDQGNAKVKFDPRTLSVIVLLAAAFPALGQDETNKPNTNWPGYREGDYVIHDYKFVSGESLPEVKLHYRTIGTAKQNAAGEVVNAVLLLQGNTGTGANWFRPTLADELFKPGQPLDAAKYYIIMPDALGRGGSSKPSDGLKGRFPHYRYHDMVDLTHRLVTDGLRVAHLRLIIGSSLGCMQQFLWAEWYPDLMDGTIGLSCQPVEISGRNYMLRHGAAEFIRHDPAWNNGEYDKSPTLYKYAAGRQLPDREPGAHSGRGADDGGGEGAVRQAPCGVDEKRRRQQHALRDRVDLRL